MRDWDFYNYDGMARSRLTDYLQRTEQPGDFVTALICPVRDLEQLYHYMLAQLSIQDATGTGLDAFGEMVNLPRLGADDDSYRQAILNKRFSSGGSGTMADVKRVLRGLTGATGKIHYVPHRPAAYVLYMDSNPAVPANTMRSMDEQSVAGVKPYVVQRVNGQGFMLAAAPTKQVNNILRVTPRTANNALKLSPLTQNNALKVNSRIIATVGSRLGSTQGEQANADARYKTTRFSGTVHQ